MSSPGNGRLLRGLALGICFVAAVATAAWVIRPWLAAPVAFDVAAAVLHFQRLVAGRQLEDPYLILTTPKPLLTLLYGSLYALTHDWRVISLAALGAWGLCVALAGELAWRLGGVLAGLFVAVSLICYAPLMVETSLALGSIWALLLWLVAGLAVTTERPHWGIAGVALALATLARLETFLIIGSAIAVLAVLRFGPASVRRPFPRRAWLVAIGLAGLPVMLAHDALLTGDPFFWSSVSIHYSAGARIAGRLPGVTDVARHLLRLTADQGAAAILALVGFGLLAVRRSWPILVGAVALGPGVALLLVLLAVRGVYVDARYYLPIEITILFMAGIGLTALRIPELAGRVSAARSGLTGGRDGDALRVGSVAIGAVAIAVLVAPTFAPLDPATRARIALARDLARTSDLAVPVLLQAIGRTTEPILVPAGLRPRLIVDLGLPVPRVTSTDPTHLDIAGDVPTDGQIIVIDEGAAVPPEPYRPFQVPAPTDVAGVHLVPLLADATHGAWVIQVDRP